jgi:hypothetical protein
MAYISFKPQDYFNTVLYTGTGTTHTITGVGFQPDFIWQKARSASQSHRAFDSVRGGDNVLYPDLNNASGTDAQLITSFNSDGFVMGTAGGNANDSATTYVAWNWKAGTTSGITTNGSTTITPTAYSFDATRGISIIKRAGSGAAGLYPHGLGVTPAMVLTKTQDGVNNWFVQSNLLGASSWTSDNYMALNSSAAKGSSSTIVNAADSVNISLAGSDDWVNSSSYNYIDYIFAPVQGFSSIGTFQGQGNADGPMVYTGFRPALVIMKNTATSSWWSMYDDKRLGYNSDNNALFPSTLDAANTSDFINIVSNGFKVITTNSNVNGSGNRFFYMAFAANPLVYSNGDIATAR